MADKPPPNLTVVSRTSREELVRQQIRVDLEWPTREMAANLLRVMRGAGRPSELPQQIINLGDAILEASKVSNAWSIWDAIETILQSAFPSRDDFDPYPDATTARGALQFLASTLVYQNAQAAAGRREMWDGQKEKQELIEARRRERAEAAAKERERRNDEIARKRKATIAKKKAEAARAKPKPEEPAGERPRSTAEFMKKRQRELSNEPD